MRTPTEKKTATNNASQSDVTPVEHSRPRRVVLIINREEKTALLPLVTDEGVAEKQGVALKRIYKNFLEKH